MILYKPWPSVITLRTFSIRTGLAASTVTPGSTAPLVSRATPAIDPVCAHPTPRPSSTHASAAMPSLAILSMPASFSMTSRSRGRRHLTRTRLRQLLRSDVGRRCFGAQFGPLDMTIPSLESGPPRVLLVEDERSIRELVSDQLRRAGYDCRSVSDGRVGLQLLLEEPFDAIVLDLMLPHVDGLTICRTVRREGLNRDAPILMLTARIAES